MALKIVLFFLCFPSFCGFKFEDAEKGTGLAPFFGKFKSMRTVSKEGYSWFIDYKILEKATNKFHQGNFLGEGGFGCVYKAQFDDGSYAAVKKSDCAIQDAEKEFEVLSLQEICFLFKRSVLFYVFSRISIFDV